MFDLLVYCIKYSNSLLVSLTALYDFHKSDSAEGDKIQARYACALDVDKRSE
jgi:hypothetical protein